MCNRYHPSRADVIARHYGLPLRPDLPAGDVFPRSRGPFVRRVAIDSNEREAVAGQWGLIPWFAKEPKLPYPTNNARSEELAAKASYKQPWARGQRCIIPAEVFWEPNWETGKNVWWRFKRADGLPCNLAGLWNTWTDKTSGEIVESYTLLTVNADNDPLMGRMHRPDPKRPPNLQDKRSVIALADADIEQWLVGSLADAAPLMRLAPPEIYDAAPEQPATGVLV